MKRKPIKLNRCMIQDNVPVEVFDRIFIGSIHSSFNDTTLQELGITNVVNATRFAPTFPQLFDYLLVNIRDK